MTSIKLSSLRGYSEAWPRTTLLYSALTDDGTLTPLAKTCKCIADQCSAVQVTVDVSKIDLLMFLDEELFRFEGMWCLNQNGQKRLIKSLPSILKLEKAE